MLIRALCLTLVRFGGPASRWAASACCDPGEGCCGGELPSCPVLPDGECSIAAAGQTLATVSPTCGQLPSPLTQPFARPATVGRQRPRALTAAFSDSAPLRYLLLLSLRN